MITLLKKSLIVLALGASALACSPYHRHRYYDRSAYGYGPSDYGSYGRGGYGTYAPFPYGGLYGGRGSGYDQHRHHHDNDHDGD